MTSARDRLFYSLPKRKDSDSFEPSKKKDQLVKYVRDSIIGNEKLFSGPYGLRKALYLDYTASGKSLGFIEDYIRNEVLPEYGNTHTTTSVTSLQTTLFRHEARDIVRNAVHASEHDSVIFVGSGSTGAVHKLIHALDLDHKPVVFVGPFEHHSNLLPWKEIGSKVLRIRTDKTGGVDLDHLAQLLQSWRKTGRQMIGCFSAASNITGILSDVDAVNVILHKHRALAFWDYATAAPYVPIDMNPVSASADQPYMYKDAVFLSCHKFVGGVQTPGVLIAKKRLFKNAVPEGCGGGSVFFVRRDGHRYLQEPELKEEGGTPAIVEAVRAGLVFQLKQAVGTPVILDREEFMLRKAIDAWRDHSTLINLGNLDVHRLPIFSFLVYNKESGQFLHHNYVSVLLNDLFGIQARGGCACAGPYAMDVLGMEETVSQKFEELLAEDSRLDRTHLRRYREYSQREILRPGFTRINLPYFLDEDSLEFTLEAVKLVAEHGWKLLPQYMFNPETGEWRQRNFQVFKDRKWLGHITYSSGEMLYKVPPLINNGPLPENYADCLQKAKDLFAEASKTRYQLPDHTVMFDEESSALRWFLLPSEAADCLHGNTTCLHTAQLPFCPPNLREHIGLPPFTEKCSEEIPVFCDMLADSKISDSGTGTCTSTSCTFQNGQKEVNLGSHKSLSFSSMHVKVEPPLVQEADIGHGDCLFVEGMVNCLNARYTEAESYDKPANENFQNNTGEDSDLLLQSSTCKVTTDRKTCIQNVPSEISDRGMNIQASSIRNTSETKEMADSKVKSDEQVKCSLSETKEMADSNIKSDEQIKGSLNDSSGLRTECENRIWNRKRHAEGQSEKLNCDVSAKRIKDKGVKGEVSTMANVTTGSAAVSKESSSDEKIDPADQRNNQSDSKTGKKGKTKKEGKGWFSPPKTIFTPFLKAVEEYEMIREGDKVLVCLSGGKDSLSLLHTMKQYQYYCKGKKLHFDMGAVTVDPQTPSYDPSPLKQYLASLGVPYFYESQGILEQASSLPYECASICSFCSRMKRGRIYACARREGYNVLALGQHLDDLCESFLMSVFHNGILRTMKAHYTVEEGDLRVIRPFVYVREKDLRTFAETNKLPVIAENCPACFEAPKERHRIKQLLAAQEIMFPRIYPSLMAAIKPIMAINKTQTKLADLVKSNETGKSDDDDFDI